MLKVGVLIKYLSENNSDNNLSSANLKLVERAFLNYLTTLDSQSSVTSDTLDNFFRQCLEYPHWQANKALLGEDVREIFSGHVAEDEDLIPDLSAVQWPDALQIIELEQISDIPAVLEIYLKSAYKNGEQFRLIANEDKKFYAIILKTDGSLMVQIFDHKMILRKGRLEPLRKDLCLHYTNKLELAPGVLQRIEVAPYTIAEFRVEGRKVSGYLLRGYTLQKSSDFEDSRLEALPKLFYAVKRAEHQFLSRETDPFYQAILKSLENGIRGLMKKDQEISSQATDIMARAQNALEYTFKGDKVLALLIRDFQHTLALNQQRTVATTDREAEAARNSQWNQKTQMSTSKHQKTNSKNQHQRWSDSTNSLPTVESLAVELLID